MAAEPAATPASPPAKIPTGSKHPMFRTSLCKSFSQAGECRYEQTCQFAHGEAELRTPPPMTSQPVKDEAVEQISARERELLDEQVNKTLLAANIAKMKASIPPGTVVLAPPPGNLGPPPGNLSPRKTLGQQAAAKPPPMTAEELKAIPHLTQHGTEPSKLLPPGSKQPEAPPDDNPKVTLVVSVPNRHIGLVIGKGGEMIRTLKQKSQAGIHVQPDREYKANPTGDRQIELNGKQVHVNEAKRLIEGIMDLADAPDGEASVKKLVGGVVGHTDKTVRIPYDAIGAMIGKGGQKIMMLQTQSGARVQLQKDHYTAQDGADAFINLSGHPKCVQYAEALIGQEMQRITLADMARKTMESGGAAAAAQVWKEIHGIPNLVPQQQQLGYEQPQQQQYEQAASPPAAMQHPQPPHPWKMDVDPKSNMPYYFNCDTQVTQWTFPEAQQPVNQFANDAAMAGQAGNAYGQYDAAAQAKEEFRRQEAMHDWRKRKAEDPGSWEQQAQAGGAAQQPRYR